MTAPTAAVRRVARRLLARALGRRGWRLVHDHDGIDPYLTRRYDSAVPLPAGAKEELRADNPELVALRQDYAALDWPVTRPSQWSQDVVASWLELEWFRGDNPYVWHYRESERVSQLKYFTYLTYVLERDPRGLVEALGEDGAFGCWTYRFPDRPPCSRDLLDSVTELYFLDRHLGVLDAPRVAVLDIGAGYGRLAHRAAQAVPGLADYVATDAVAESTFLCAYYCRYRGVIPPVEVVRLDAVPDLEPGRFDLALNVHGFSEMPLEAVTWWLEHVARLEVPALFVVPNEAQGWLSLEPDGSRRDYRAVIEGAGYHLDVEEPFLLDPAVRALVDIQDRFTLFRRA